MKATVLYDEHGRILAVSQVEDRDQAGSTFDSVGMVPGPGQRALEAEFPDDLAERAPASLHEEFRVDPVSGSLVRKGSPAS